MEFKSCYGKKFDLEEGMYISGSFDNESDVFQIDGIVFLSLGQLICEDGSYASLTDMTSYSKKLIRKATESEIKNAIKNFDKDDTFLFDSDFEIAKRYLDNCSDEEVLPVKYGIFNSKEELLKALEEIVC